MDRLKGCRKRLQPHRLGGIASDRMLLVYGWRRTSRGGAGPGNWRLGADANISSCQVFSSGAVWLHAEAPEEPECRAACLGRQNPWKTSQGLSTLQSHDEEGGTDDDRELLKGETPMGKIGVSEQRSRTWRSVTNQADDNRSRASLSILLDLCERTGNACIVFMKAPFPCSGSCVVSLG